jgi:23S rRNA (guanosine2251-2'-O)-methyltransferase
MVERSRRGRRKQKLLGSHQRCWLWGRHLVTETLRAGRWPPLELRLSDRLPAGELYQARELADQRGVQPLVQPHEELTRLARSTEHQGYLAKMPPFPYDDVAAVLGREASGGNSVARLSGPVESDAGSQAIGLSETPAGTAPLYLILDRIQDPYNFGAVLRSADGLGVDAVFVGTVGQSEVTSLVARASAGAINHVPLARTDNLPGLIDRLRAAVVNVAAATHTADTDVFACDLKGPTAIVVGNEGVGVRPEILSRCDQQIRIPQFGRVSSLNAAVSAGIILYEVCRQRLAADT